MSRKSKLTLWKEKLEQISDCPGEIFNIIEPDEELFLKIENAERGEISSIKELATSLYETYKNEEELNAALLYYARRGLELGDRDCAVIALRCISRFNTHFELLDDVLALVDDGQNDGHIDRLITKSRVKRIIASATPDADYEMLTSTLSEMYDEYSAYARIYLASQRLKDTGYYDSEKTDALAIALDVPRVITLPVFLGDKECAKEVISINNVTEHSAMKYALGLIDMDEWRDFWLRAIYEYSEKYLDGNLLPFASEMIDSISERSEYPKKKLHKLALRKYIFDLTGSGRSKYTSLETECRFDGIEFDISTEDGRDEVIKEAVYTDSAKERVEHLAVARLGRLIVHTKNRYSLTATLNGHIKRGSKHLWPVTLSMLTSQDTPPVLTSTRITERRHEVKRGGITLEPDKKVSQVLCAGEIIIGDKPHPFEADLVLDISYVSTTKCEWFDIKIKELERLGDHLVMHAMICIW